MNFQGFDHITDEKLKACMIGYVRAKQEDGLLLIDIPIDNLHPEYLEYVADTCRFEMGLDKV